MPKSNNIVIPFCVRYDTAVQRRRWVPFCFVEESNACTGLAQTSQQWLASRYTTEIIRKLLTA